MGQVNSHGSRRVPIALAVLTFPSLVKVALERSDARVITATENVTVVWSLLPYLADLATLYVASERPSCTPSCT